MFYPRSLTLVFVLTLTTGVIGNAEEPSRVSSLELALGQLAQVPFEQRESKSFGQRAAAINQQLSQVSTDERYEILKGFAFPTGTTDGRVVSAACPVVAPPKEFARLAGIRSSRNAFLIPSVGGVDGLFNTAWLLIQAAKDAGRTGELSEQIESLQGPRSKVLQAILFASQEGSESKITSLLTQYANHAQAKDVSPVEIAVLAAVCPEGCRDIINDLIETTLARSSLASSTKATLAKVRFSAREQKQLAAFQINQDWIAVGDSNDFYSVGDRLALLRGNNVRYVYRYPLAGDFQFLIQNRMPGNSGGCLMQFAGQDLDLDKQWRQNANRREFLVTEDRFRYQVNGYHLGDFPNNPTFPWLSLTPNSDSDDPLVHMKMSGSPTIPRSVKLLGNDSTVGWSTSDDALPGDGVSVPLSVADGVIEVAKPQESGRQQWIRYFRPLQTGEVFEYEFFASDQHAAHPAFGRLAFLLKPKGIAVHWITESETDWTGLADDNELVEPLNRRGPRQLPIRMNDWNQVSLSLSDNGVSMKLNDAIVYERSVQAGDDTRFGWFQDPSMNAIRVRESVLRGDWPQVPNTTAIAKPREQTPTRAAVATRFFKDLEVNVFEVAEAASRLDAKKRFNFLTDWVFPNEYQKSLRIQGDFAPFQSAKQDETKNGDQKSRLIWPALDLVNVAEELKKLDELAQRIQLISSEDIALKRCRAALLIVIQNRMGNRSDAAKYLEKYFDLNFVFDEFSAEDLWPDYLIAYELMKDPSFREDLVELLLMHPLADLDGDHAIVSQLTSLRNEVKRDQLEDFAGKPPVLLDHWIPTSRFSAQSHSSGRSEPKWESIAGGVRQITNHSRDLLFFESPLQGDSLTNNASYEVQFESQIEVQGGVQGGAGLGIPVQIGDSLVKFDAQAITVDGGAAGKVSFPIEPPLNIVAAWICQRYVAEDGICSIYVNGRKIHQLKVGNDPSWLALQFSLGDPSVVRDLKISGKPAIPESVQTVTPSLSGWCSYYENRGVGEVWEYQGGSIVGKREDFPSHCGRERLLYYQRPLTQKDVMQYEFYYEPEKKIVHPALDRTAFVIAPDQVRLHDITDGKHDLDFIDKNNLRTDAQGQRERPAEVLKEKAWNKAEVLLDSGRMELRLNGVLVYEGETNQKDQGLFGFFYFSDRSSALVRSVSLRGAWLKDLLPQEDQQLANPQLAKLNDSRDELAQRIHRDFGNEKVPDELFRIFREENSVLATRDEGVEVVVSGGVAQKLSGLERSLSLAGDFDVSADFGDFQLQHNDSKKSRGSVRLEILLEGEGNPIFRVERHASTTRQQLSGSSVIKEGNGKFQSGSETIDLDSTSGTLRIARRGETMFALFRETGSSGFRLIQTSDVPATPSRFLRLLSIASNSTATKITWKNLDARAERINSGEKKKVIMVANADGTNVRQLDFDSPLKTSNGSPQFSPDGKQIAFHIGTGGPSNSRVCVINSDGTDQKTLATGSLPTWSPDGKRLVISYPPWQLAMMDADGGNQEVICDRGWGARISPKGDQIVYRAFTSYGSGNLLAMNLETRVKRKLLSGDAQRYGNLLWNYSWSPDGRWIAFQGRDRNTGKRVFAIVSEKGSDDGFRIIKPDADNFLSEITWFPAGDKLLVCGQGPNDVVRSHHVLKLNDPDYCEPLFKISNPSVQVEPAFWSADGSKLVFMASVPDVAELTVLNAK